MHEALGHEASEEALDDPLLQVHVDHVVIERAGVFKDHWADW